MIQKKLLRSENRRSLWSCIYSLLYLPCFLCRLLGCFLLRCLAARADEDEAQNQRDDVHHQREVKHILITDRVHLVAVDLDEFTGVVDDVGSHLVAGQTREGPGRKRDAMDRGDAAHSVMVGQKRRNIGVSSAVACVYDHDQAQGQRDQQTVAVAILDTAGHHHQCGEGDGQDEDDLVDRIAVLLVIRPGGESETTARIEDRGDRGNDTGGCHEADALDDRLLLRDQRQTAGDIDIEHQPDTDVVRDRLRAKHLQDARLLLIAARLMPVGGLRQDQMTDEHHDKIHTAQDPEHLVDTALGRLQDGGHDRACDRLCSAEACDGETGSQSLIVLEPEHQRLDRAQISGTQTYAHDEAVTHIDADQRKYASLMAAAVPDEESGQDHTGGKADGRDQRGLVDVLLHHVAQEGRAHAQEKDGKAESPFHGALGKSDVIRDLLAENGPAVHGTDAAMKQQCGNCGANPFIKLCHRLVDHGRAVCTARTTPHCDQCCLEDICKKNY